MNNNKIILIIAFVALIIIITVPTILTVEDRHNKALLKTMDNKIIESAKKCLNDNKCDDEDNITLKELYEKKYLTKVINPVTNEYVKDSS